MDDDIQANQSAHLESDSATVIQQFWESVNLQIKAMTTADFREQHELPLARIKKIMKLDEDVKMISAEAPVLFAKAAEIFVRELTLRAWLSTEENRRRTLQKNDIALAISKFDQFDFLIDIVPREEIRRPREPEGFAAARNKSSFYTVQLPSNAAPGVQTIQQVPQSAVLSSAAPVAGSQPQILTLQLNNGQSLATAGNVGAQPLQAIQVQSGQTIQLPNGQIIQIGGATSSGATTIQLAPSNQQAGGLGADGQPQVLQVLQLGGQPQTIATGIAASSRQPQQQVSVIQLPGNVTLRSALDDEVRS